VNQDKKKYKYVVKRHARKYDDVTQSFNDRAEFLKKDRYKKALDYVNDPKRFATEIAAGGYATALNYAATIHSLIDRIQAIIVNEKLDKTVIPVTPVTPVTPAKPKTGKIATRRLNIRNKPSSDADKVDELKEGTPVEILAERGDWYMIKELYGWILMEHLDANKVVIPRKLNVRDVPDGKKIGTVDRDTKLNLLEIQGIWGKFLFEQHWATSQFITLDK